jgi:hypothetical protein
MKCHRVTALISDMHVSETQLMKLCKSYGVVGKKTDSHNRHLPQASAWTLRGYQNT